MTISVDAKEFLMFAKRILYRSSFVTILALLLASVAIAAVGAQDADIMEGNRLYEAGDYEAAYVPLRRAAFANPMDTQTLRRYLFSLLYAGKYADIEYPSNILRFLEPDAISELKTEAAELVQSAPDDLRAAHVAAALAVDTGDPAQGDAIERVFALDPDGDFGYDLRAYVAFYSNDAEGGREAAERALALAPEDPHIIIDLALPFAWALNDTDRALELLTQAISLDPTLAEGYGDRATLYANFLGDAESALPDFNRAIELDPGNFTYFLGRGFAHLGLEDYALAQADFEQTIELFPPTIGGMVGLVNTGIAAGTSIDVLLENRDLVEAAAALTVGAPYAGDMIFNRIVGVPITVEAGEYTVTLSADDPMALDPLLIVTDGDNIPLAFNDDMNGQGAREEGAFNAQATFTAGTGESYIAWVLHSRAGSEGAFTVTVEAGTP